MYSKKIQTLLKRKGIKITDRICVTKGKTVFEGLLMPRPEIGNPGCLVLKLDSGYNIGIEIDNNTNIEKAKTKEPEDVLKETKFELGKVRKELVKLVFDKNKPPVSLIATGGTIASRVDYRTGGVYALNEPKELLYNIPELADIVNVREMITPFTRMSEDMDPQEWIIIAKHVKKSLDSGDKGVIVTHGTDTLHYTAAALSFFLRNLYRPVVLVGAQRSIDRGSSDAGMNLICSAHVSVSEIAEVGICMHGEINDSFCLFIRGTKARKMHTSRRDAFRPINSLPLAKIWPDGKIETVNEEFKKRNDKEDVVLDAKFQPKVGLLKVYPGSDPGIIDYFAGKGYKGFVIEGTGLGHVPTFAKKPWIPVIKKHIKDGIPFVITSQTLYGRVNPNVYTNLRILYHETGAIPGEDMLPETAYVKLGWVLGHTEDMEKIKEMMLTNYAGEITKRSLDKTFLY